MAKKLTPAQLAALRMVATGTVSYNEGLRDRGRFAIRHDTINRSTMYALSRRGLTAQETTDRHYRRRVVLTQAGQEALAAATTESPKETL